MARGKQTCKILKEIRRQIAEANGIEFALDREALWVVNLFPDFIPGQHEGKNVNVWFTIPITFRLSDR